MLKFEKQKHKQLKAIVTHSFGLADAFSLSPPLRILKQDRFSTQCGKIASICLLVIFLIQFVYALQGVLNYEQVSVVSKQIYSQNTQPMYFTPNNFTLALSFLNANQGAIQNIQSLLNITIQNCHISRTFNNNGVLNVSRICFEYPIEYCSMQNHFVTQAQQSMFISRNLSNVYCIKSDLWQNRSLVLQGTGTDDNYQFINVIATICQNTTTSQKCASQSEIQSKLTLLYYSFYYNDLLTQMDSVKQPFQPLIRLTTTSISILQTKSFLQNNQIQQIQSDTGHIFDNWIANEGISIYNTQVGNDPYNGQYLLWHLIQQYNVIMNYQRTYHKIQTILGQLGGLWQLMYYAVLLIIYPVVSMKMNMELANKLFSFAQYDDREQVSIDQDKSISMKRSIFKQPIKKKLDINDESQIAKFLKNKKSSLEIGAYTIFLQLCGCRKQEKLQLNYAKQKIFNKLDVSYILTKLIEIDNLKQILLTKDQRHLFNHLPKPTIPKALFRVSQRVAVEENPRHEIILQEEKSDLMKLQDAFGAYKNITSATQLYPIDQKLLNQLDTDIYNLFKQIEQEGDDLPNSNLFKRSVIQSMDMTHVRQDFQMDSIRRPVLSQSQIDIEEQAQLPR